MLGYNVKPKNNAYYDNNVFKRQNKMKNVIYVYYNDKES